MIIYTKLKKNYKIVIINIILLIVTYYLSFVLFPKFNSTYSKYDYINIKTSSEIHFFQEYFLKNETIPQEYDIQKEKFNLLNRYIVYLKKTPSFKEKTPCPLHIFDNDLRNIHLYEHKNDKYDEFSVSFFVNRFSMNRIDMDQCFKFIFVDNFNKYFSLEISNLTVRSNNAVNLMREIEDSIKLEISQDFFANYHKINLAKIALLKKYRETSIFIVDPNNQYKHEKNINDKNLIISITAFIIILLTIIIIQIGFLQKNFKKKITQFINNYINT